MEPSGRSSVNVKDQIVPYTMRTALSSALLEWFLIFLLFIDAIFSYMVTKFARYCKLQVPCLLCSRLDHVLGKEKEEFYWDLVCRKHKLKISSLVFCHLHENLVDVHGMCESCLFSFATVNKSNAEIYRLLIGKLGDEPHLGLDPDFLAASDHSNVLNGRKCTCCNEQFISRGHDEMIFQTKTIGYPADFSAPLAAINRHYRVEPKELTDVLFQRVNASTSMESDIDHLPHVEYQKVNTSDTESIGYETSDLHEPLLATGGHDKDELKELLDVSSQKVLISVSGKGDINSLLHVEYEKAKITADLESNGYEAAGPDAPLLMTNGYDKNKLKDFTDESSQEVKASQVGKNGIDHLPHIEYEKVNITSDTESEASISDKDNAVHVLDRNLNLAAEYRKKEDLIVGDLASEEVANPSEMRHSSMLDSELHVEAIDLHSMASPAPSSHGLEELNWQHVKDKTDTVAPELVSFSDILPSSNAAQSSTNMPEDTFNFKEVAKLGKAAAKECNEMAELASNLMSTNEKQSDLKPAISSDTSLQAPKLLELGDAYKLAVGSTGRQLSGKLLDQKSFKDSTKVSEDFKLLLSQLSAARGIELQLNDMSPRFSGNIDELRTEPCSSIGMQILQKRISLERNESGISLDGSTVSEIEGENIVDRLKRQVEHDKKIMGALYKELEEERNASAVAANQAMAMITRLQEEKAALHMEALQCLRMMEEQAEYDDEALQKATDLLAEKEKEIQHLEAELEAHKKLSACITRTANSSEPTCDFNALEPSLEKFKASLEQRNTTVRSTGDIMPTTCRKDDNTFSSSGDGNIYQRSFAFEDESLSILQSLRELEKKLELFSNSYSFSDTSNGNFPEEKKTEMGTPENDETNLDTKNTIVNTGSCSASEGSAFRHEDSEQESKGHSEGQSGKNLYRDIDLDDLRNEFLALNNRLRSLEVEQNFLKHSMSSVSKGDEGLKFIQDMACQVRELHTLGIGTRN